MIFFIFPSFKKVYCLALCCLTSNTYLFSQIDEDAVGGEQGGENEDEKELITYFISTSVQFTSSKMNRYLFF